MDLNRLLSTYLQKMVWNIGIWSDVVFVHFCDNEFLFRKCPDISVKEIDKLLNRIKLDVSSKNESQKESSKYHPNTADNTTTENRLLLSKWVYAHSRTERFTSLHMWGA